MMQEKKEESESRINSLTPTLSLQGRAEGETSKSIPSPRWGEGDRLES